MLMKFSYATFFALTSISGIDAFLAPKRSVEFSVLKAVADGTVPDNEEFLSALKGSSGNTEDDDTGDQVSSGSSRFKDLMEASKSAQPDVPSAGRPIENPFLNPTNPSPQPSAFDTLSVEQQAEMFRQMMAGGMANPAAPAAAAAPLEKQKRTDMAGKPVGRNRDADAIANTADVYFAQLKRDSTVRTLARVKGDEEVAQSVFKDEGIKELEDLIHKNPYLKGQQDEERKLFDGIQEEAVKVYAGGKLSEAEKNTSGISYKEILKQKRAKKSGGAQSSPSAPVKEEPVVAQSEPEPVVQEPVPEPVPEPEPVVAEIQPQAVAQPPEPVKTVEAPAAVIDSAPKPVSQTQLSPEETRQKLRTFMGLLLKHRGGPNFGKGRLKGPEIDRFENLLDEITSMLRNESMEDVPMMTSPPESLNVAPSTPVAEAPVSPVASQAPAAPSSSADLSQIDSAIACIEGASTMYKNSPPALRESILVPLRGALVSAVDTCNNVSGNTEPTDYGVSQPGTDISAIDGALACIEGAVTMYKNSPPNLRKDIVVALRAALVSAVSTCNSVMSPAAPPAQPVEVATPPPVATESYEAPAVEGPPEIVAPLASEVPVPVQDPASDMGPDANTIVLEKIYNKIKNASGSGSLGLRSDLTTSEASDLADDLVQMRSILMDELDAGIPDPGTSIPEPSPVKARPSVEVKSSTASKYQQMLAKAKAEKAANA